MLIERSFGHQPEGGGDWWLFPEEALYLVEEGYLEVASGKSGQPLSFPDLRSHLEKLHKGCFLRYLVYRDLRRKGYLPKAGAKYGVDFRVYEPGVKPRKGAKQEGEHARFLVKVVTENDRLTATGLVGLNRITHSVKKLLWLAVVDQDLDVTYVQMSRAQP